MSDASRPPEDLAERNRQVLESRGIDAALYFAFHDTRLVCVEHYQDGLFYRPRYVQRRDADDEHWMILYEADNGAEYVSTLNDFFGYALTGSERMGRFKVVEKVFPRLR